MSEPPPPEIVLPGPPGIEPETIESEPEPPYSASAPGPPTIVPVPMPGCEPDMIESLPRPP